MDFKQSLYDPEVFSVTWELVFGRGSFDEPVEDAVKKAKSAAADGRIHAVTITDSPGGNPAISAAAVALELKQAGLCPVVHFTAKDRNRNEIESQLYALHRQGLDKLLVMTGDYQSCGQSGRGKPVFDIDCVQILDLVSRMNAGLEFESGGGIKKIKPTDFFAGCVVSPFKKTEAEQMTQYYKLKKKLERGAGFVVGQVGFDARKLHELRLYMTQNHPGVPLIGNLYVLSPGAARLMYANKIPGCVVTGKLLHEILAEKAPSAGEAEPRLLRAAKLFAIIKGMGYSGVHIGGHGLGHAELDYIITKGGELSSRWRDFIREFEYPMPDGYYYYRRDNVTRLNLDTPVKNTKPQISAALAPTYLMSRAVNYMCMKPGKRMNVPLTKYAKISDGKLGGAVFHSAEKVFKKLVYNCQDCGDCALTATAYTCPMSNCPKNQRNGPCGGGRDGFCEVFPGARECVFVRSYKRLRQTGEQESLRDIYVPPYDWQLSKSSGWFNMLLGRDGSSRSEPTVPEGDNLQNEG